ncbi:hypothetical protein WJX77_001007 [Trebouxia sp. C0004]
MDNLELPFAFSEAILRPTPMPTEVAPISELQAIIHYLRCSRFAESSVEFERGIVHPDGRLDLCKQGVACHLPAITAVLTKNTTIHHLLIGNDIVGQSGAVAISQLLAVKSLKTLYLAGNCLGSESIQILCDGLINSDGAVEQLWLKRNPIHTEGAAHLGAMLSLPAGACLQVLDLDNTGLFDDGIAILMSSLRNNSTLQTLYVSANGITHIGAAHIARYFEAHTRDGITSLYLSMNPIGPAGAETLAESLKGNLSLCRLVLDSDRIHSRGARALFTALEHHPTIEFLSLGKAKSTSDLQEQPNNISNEAMTSIANFILKAEQLKVLNLGTNDFTESACLFILAACLKSKSLVSLTLGIVGMPVAGRMNMMVRDHMKWNMNALQSNSGQSAETILRCIKSGESVVNIASVYRNRLFREKYRNMRASRRAQETML